MLFSKSLRVSQIPFNGLPLYSSNRNFTEYDNGTSTLYLIKLFKRLVRFIFDACVYPSRLCISQTYPSSVLLTGISTT